MMTFSVSLTSHPRRVQMSHDETNNSGSHYSDIADDIVSWTYSRTARPSGPLICHIDKAEKYNEIASSAKTSSSLITEEH